MKPYFQDEQVTLHHGDAYDVAQRMASGSVDCIITSPPYYGLRDYGSEGQYGLEESPAAYIETMRDLFAELRRVLADDGTLWLNIGDSYGPDKSLLGIPWQTALALRDDGWTVRNAIIWAKPNAMPDGVPDRLSGRYEHVFLFSKSRRYWFDLDSIREPAITADRTGSRASFKNSADNQHVPQWSRSKVGSAGMPLNELGRNPGDVWEISTQPFSAAHFAVMPVTLAQRCVLAGCKPGGVVLDPFNGSGTTGLAAQKTGRKYVGIDLNSEYLDLSLRTRLCQQTLGLEDAG